MIEGLKSYDKVRQSRMDWLETLPAHWDEQSLGSLIAGRSERNRTDLPLLSVVRELGIVPRDTLSRADNHNFVPEDLTNYKAVRQNDLVVNKMKAWQGALGISPCDGIVSPAYFVYETYFSYPKYYHALLRSHPYVGQFARASDGVRIGQWDLDPEAFKRIAVPVPPVEERVLITRFLEWHWIETIRYIRLSRKIVGVQNQKSQSIAVGAGLIQEFRTRLVSDVVTGQLDVRALAASLPEVAEANVPGELTEEVDLDDDADALIDEEEAA